jgi:imidazolonepropionase-like amidohydrolase
VLDLEGIEMLFSQSHVKVWMALLWFGSAVLCNSVEARGMAFVGVNVISVEEAKVLEDHTVVVDEGRIVAVGPRASTPVPDDVPKIDGTGKYLMPGLADMHIHLMDQEFVTALLKKDDPLQPIENMLYLYLANGVTTVRVMAGYPELLTLRDAIARGEVLGPRLIVTTPMFDGKKPIWPAPLGRPIPTAEAARTAVQESKKDGYDMIKVYTFLGRDAYDAVIEEAQKVDLKVVGHVPIAVGLDHALASGQDEITHGEEYWRFTRDYSDEVVAKFTDMTLKSGTWYSPTMTTYQDQMGDVEAVLKRPENRYLEPLILEFWTSRVNQLAVAYKSPRMVEQAQNLGGFMRRLVKSMYDAGVPLMVATDALNPAAMPGFSLHRELQLFEEVGIPNHETLRAATTGPAEFMEETGEWGAVATGHRADLVLLNANPLEDITNTKKIEGVMVRGQWLTDESIQVQLDEFAAKSAGSDAKGK